MTRYAPRMFILRLVVSLLALGGATGLVSSPVSAAGPLAQFVMSPSPMAPAASLSSGSMVSITLTAKDANGAAIPGLTLYLVLFSAVASTPGTASAQGHTLTTNPSSTPVVTDGSGQVAITYTAGNATTGKDQIKAQDSPTHPTIDGRDNYLYFAGSYTFTPSPIAAPGSLVNPQTVTGKVCVLNGLGAAIPGATAWLAYLPAAGSSGGSVGAGNGTPVALTSTPQSFTADSLGCIAWTFTAPSTQPKIGFDAIQVQDASTHAGVIQTDKYSFGATYVAVVPNRLVDSRIALGLPSHLFSGFTNAQSFQVTNRIPADPTKNIPAGVSAVTGNLTVTGQNASGAFSLTPSKPKASPTTSSLNFPVGDNRGNGVTVALSAGGTLWVSYLATAGATADVVFDVTGYFVPDASGATYVALPPSRLLDSRFGNGLSGKFSARAPRTFQVTGRGGVAANAVAVTGNLTVTNQTVAGAAYLGPDPNAFPTTSTLNFPVGDNRGNALTVALGAGGTLSATYIASSGTTDLVFDVTGYFVPDASGAAFVALPPSRLLDSRFGNGLSGKFSARAPRTFQVTGRGGVPANAVAVTGNLTVTNQTVIGAAYLGPDPIAFPTTSTLNFPVGDNRGNALTVALGAGGTLSATYIASSGTTDLVFDVTGYFVP